MSLIRVGIVVFSYGYVECPSSVVWRKRSAISASSSLLMKT